jgi:hypothetical protein
MRDCFQKTDRGDIQADKHVGNKSKRRHGPTVYAAQSVMHVSRVANCSCSPVHAFMMPSQYISQVDPHTPGPPEGPCWSPLN